MEAVHKEVYTKEKKVAWKQSVWAYTGMRVVEEKNHYIIRGTGDLS